jgi:hypothetical protein
MPARLLPIIGLTLLSLLLASPTRALAHGEGPQQTIDGYLVTLVVPQRGWYTGANPVEVILWDAAGMAVDATVTLAPLAYAPAEEGHGDTHSDTPAAPEDAHAAGDTAHNAAPAAPEDAHAAGDTAHTDSHAANSEAHGTEGTAHTDSHATSTEVQADDHSGDGQGLAPLPVSLAPSDEPDAYSGELAFDRPGTWTVSVVFVVDGEEHGTTFELAVAQSRPRGLVLGGFALVNGLAIATAAVLKRRAPSRPANKAARPTPTAAPSAEEQPK